jgi:hypothetical protein
VSSQRSAENVKTLVPYLTGVSYLTWSTVILSEGPFVDPDAPSWTRAVCSHLWRAVNIQLSVHFGPTSPCLSCLAVPLKYILATTATEVSREARLVMALPRSLACLAKSSHVNTSRLPVLPVVSQHCYIAYYFSEAEGSTAHPVSSCKAALPCLPSYAPNCLACPEHLHINDINCYAALLASIPHAASVHCDCIA